MKMNVEYVKGIPGGVGQEIQEERKKSHYTR